MLKFKLITLLIFSVFFISCNNNIGNANQKPDADNQQNTQQDSVVQNQATKDESQDDSQEAQNPTPQLPPDSLTKELLTVAKNRDIKRFIALIPDYGVIISIDNFIDTTSGDHILTPDFDVNKPLFWGVAPSGDSIIMTFEEMFNSYLAKDFLAGMKSNQPKCMSTVEFNTDELWQNITLYEYCLNPPTKGNDMLNWQAIRFIFSGDSLVAIVLDKWSP
ncbi:MAG: hypothetical protein GXO48_01225 [Chlorobi bacterium]|nr:hypothetical protein [Chlorobiota bacterium]